MLDGKPVRVACFALDLAGTSAHGIVLVEVAETLSKRKQMAREIMAGMVLPQLLMVCLAGIMVWYGVKRGLRPLDKLRTEIGQRSHLDLSAVSAESAPQEVQPLLLSMNELMARVRQAMELQQRFIADASHQLRTPLAGLQTQAEVALREHDPANVRHALERILESTVRLSHLVAQLLALARVEPGPGREASSMQPLDLARLAREVTAEWVSAALARDIDLGFECTEGEMMVSGDAVLLREMLANLLDNAIRYMVDSGEITVHVFCENSQVLLAVEDHGPGIPVTERERVFERFYRLPDSTSGGCGLGLAIVREIVLAHQAKITITDSANGHGARVTVAFPAC
jgi:two-component system sensor histidine kinase TctE